MKRIVAAVLLVAFVLSPCAALSEPIVCDYALETGKIVDWLVCALVVIALGGGESIPGGYYVWY